MKFVAMTVLVGDHSQDPCAMLLQEIMCRTFRIQGGSGATANGESRDQPEERKGGHENRKTCARGVREMKRRPGKAQTSVVTQTQRPAVSYSGIEQECHSRTKRQARGGEDEKRNE